MFVGRREELKELKERYDSDKIEIICVLGRRRVGKSQLIFESQKTFNGLVIAFECGDLGYVENLKSLEKLIQKTFNNNYLSFSSLYDILNFLQNEAKKQKILFIIDEYPYMREGKKTDSEIKNAIDDFNKLEKKNPLKFVLCGSSVQVMELLDDANMPLHGRFNKIIRLFPLNYLDSSLFYENVSEEDKIRYYSVLGGVPYYLEQINPLLTFKENIINLFFSSSALLRAELENQINGEINRVEKATYILNILKNRIISYTDIKQKYNTAFPNGNINYALKKLQDMRIIEKVSILQDNGIDKSYYQIVDNSIMFYYTFLAQPFANRMLFNDNEYYDLFINDSLNHLFIPKAFESISKEFIAIMNKFKKLDYRLLDLFPYIINDKKTKKNYQFDIVGKAKEGLINFECKYQDGPINKGEVYNEERQAELANSHFIDTVFISKSVVKTDSKVYCLKDMFKKDLFI